MATWTCPVHWCNTCEPPDKGEDAVVTSHMRTVFEYGTGLGTLGVRQVIDLDEKGHMVALPATIYVDEPYTHTMLPSDAEIMAKGFEMAAMLARAINAGDWGIPLDYRAAEQAARSAAI